MANADTNKGTALTAQDLDPEDHAVTDADLDPALPQEVLPVEIGDITEVTEGAILQTEREGQKREGRVMTRDQEASLRKATEEVLGLERAGAEATLPVATARAAEDPRDLIRGPHRDLSLQFASQADLSLQLRRVRREPLVVHPRALLPKTN